MVGEVIAAMFLSKEIRLDNNSNLSLPYQPSDDAAKKPICPNKRGAFEYESGKR